MTETTIQTQLDPDAVVRSFKGMDCPTCDSWKPRNTALCGSCLKLLPDEIVRELNCYGRRHENGLVAAAAHLNVELRIEVKRDLA